jgi:hypothetical protein
MNEYLAAPYHSTRVPFVSVMRYSLMPVMAADVSVGGSENKIITVVLNACNTNERWRTSHDRLPGDATELVAELNETLLLLLARLPHHLTNSANLMSGGA